MKIKGITDECFTEYKTPAMFIAFPNCTFKCNIDAGCNVCQNYNLSNEPIIEISKEDLINRFLTNPITSAIVLGGLEPFDSLLDLSSFIDCLRNKYECNAPIIIYTGYTESEIESGKFGSNSTVSQSIWQSIKSSGNIIVKFGRFKPNQPKHYDDILGVSLASSNQYAKYYK